MASSSRAAAPPALPEELVEEILLRVDSAADLARASAACSSFHRLVSSRSFLRRFRSLHPPPVLGFLGPGGHGRFLRVEPPHRSAPAARALAHAADFTFSFLPAPQSTWRLCHARDGRVLLSRRIATATATALEEEDLVVCDPLHRRYVRIPPIPGDLAGSIPRPVTGVSKLFLAPAGEEDEDEESSFRVIYALQSENKFMALVFSSGSNKWRGVTYHASGSLIDASGFLLDASFRYHVYYAHGCVYWLVDPISPMGSSTVLDTREMKFSILKFPRNDYGFGLAVVEVGEGKLGLLTFRDESVHLFCKIWRSSGAGAQEWQHDRMIPLPKDCDGLSYSWFNMGTGEGYLSLLALREFRDNSPTPGQYFVLDIKTWLLERLCTSGVGVFLAHLYASFPPPLALPSI